METEPMFTGKMYGGQEEPAKLRVSYLNLKNNQNEKNKNNRIDHITGHSIPWL